jgi:hypothetical protein
MHVPKCINLARLGSIILVDATVFFVLAIINVKEVIMTIVAISQAAISHLKNH